ncbi:hypothetical protein ACH4NT_28915 [Streptomyces lydicus]|uniref:hypothetical protein n=1 Tax=Streptomyces lydicus TaxID=47763 RepID=UPI0037B26346
MNSAAAPVSSRREKTRGLKKRGITVRTDATLTGAELLDDGVRVTVRTAGGLRDRAPEAVGETLLTLAGRGLHQH